MHVHVVDVCIPSSTERSKIHNASSFRLPYIRSASMIGVYNESCLHRFVKLDQLPFSNIACLCENIKIPYSTLSILLCFQLLN